MSVGLYDCDLATLRSYPLNLDIMKLSAYYKLKKNEIVTLTDYFNPAPYSKYIIRKDYQDGVFPKRMANYDNIEYGGLGFTNGNYISLPEEMELMLPDYSIYTNILQKPAFKCQKKWVGVGKKVSHFRLSLDGKNIWDKFPSTMPHIGRNGVLFSHDYNITDIKDSYECICDLSMSTFGTLSNYLPNFGTKFPIIVDNFEDLTKWLKISLSRGTFLQYNGFLEDG